MVEVYMIITLISQPATIHSKLILMYQFE